MRRYPAQGPIHPAEYAQPYAWWGWHWSPPVPLSVVEIVEAGTLDRRLAALLWVLLEARRSVLLASEPPMSGKTTLLTALLPFLPAGTRLVFVRGLSETFDYAREADPGSSYLLVNELSSHLPVYLWGRKAARMFETLRAGYGFATTMHADGAPEVIAQLRDELGVGLDGLERLDVIAIMRLYRGDEAILGHDDVPPEMRYGPAAIRRRLVSAHLVVREGSRIELPCLCAWEPATDAHDLTLEPHLAELARRAGRSVDDLCVAVMRREAFLAELAARGVRRPRDVAEAIGAYREEGLEAQS